MACPAPDVFNALVANRLDVETRASIADHAASCEDCHDLLAALVAPAQPLPPQPSLVGRYVIERRVGAGAMGLVYAARDPELERRVAIKVLRGTGSASRLKREAQALARLQHPNVVAVYDVGEHDGQTFVAMALVDGENLRAWLARPHETDEILRVLRDAAAGLIAAHEADLLHRDIKPDNIFVGSDGKVLVGDFGLARSDGELDPAASAQGLLDLTQTGMVLGTPAYMAPEQAAGDASAASDQFSFCVTAWEALFGTRPFDGKTYGELRDHIRTRTFAAPAGDRRVPAYVRTALERGLSAEPGDRWPSLAALRARLTPPRRRWPWIAGGIGLLAAAAAVVIIRPGGDPCVKTTHELDRIWTPAARTSLKAELPILDGYVRDWGVLRHDACRTSNDLRARCLARARDALAALVGGVKADTDPMLVHRGVVALPVLADCKSALAGSASPEQIRRGEELMKALDTEEVRVALAGTTNLDAIRALAQQADDLGYEPAIVTAALVEADALERATQQARASDRLHHALTAAEAEHDDRGVARVASALGTLLVGLDKLDEARTMIDLADAAIKRAGGDANLALQVIRGRALLAGAQGDHAAAIELARQAVAQLVETRPGSPELGEAYMLLAREAGIGGRADVAADASEHAQKLILAATGQELGASLISIDAKINDALFAGDASLALDRAQQFVELARATKEPSAEIEAVGTLARIYLLRSDGRKMIEVNQQVLDLLAKTPDGGAADVRGEAYEGIGRGWLLLHEPARAVDPLRQALDIDTKGGASLAASRAWVTSALAEALTATGHAREARELLEPLLPAEIEGKNVPLTRRGAGEIALAHALWTDGGDHERDRARSLARDALRDYQAALDAAKAPGGLIIQAPRIEAKVAEITDWQKKHP